MDGKIYFVLNINLKRYIYTIKYMKYLNCAVIYSTQAAKLAILIFNRFITVIFISIYYHKEYRLSILQFRIIVTSRKKGYIFCVLKERGNIL